MKIEILIIPSSKKTNICHLKDNPSTLYDTAVHLYFPRRLFRQGDNHKLFIYKSFIHPLWQCKPFLPFEKAIPSKMTNILIAATFSILAAATAKVGIPLSTPKPCSWRLSILNTTTAGDTAAITKLQKKIQCLFIKGQDLHITKS